MILKYISTYKTLNEPCLEESNGIAGDNPSPGLQE